MIFKRHHPKAGGLACPDVLEPIGRAFERYVIDRWTVGLDGDDRLNKLRPRIGDRSREGT